jgi:hypothetical protein
VILVFRALYSAFQHVPAMEHASPKAFPKLPGLFDLSILALFYIFARTICAGMAIRPARGCLNFPIRPLLADRS